MTEERFDLIFRGDIVLGQPLATVKARLQQLFKADADKIEQLFTGRPVAVKRRLDRATAQKYQQVLHKAGAQVEMVPARAEGDGGASAKGAPPRPSAQPVARGLSLAPVGPLLKPSERPHLTPVSVDISGLSLRPAQGPLLDASERIRIDSAEVSVPSFELAEPGEDLLSEQERDSLPLMAVEPEDWGLADVGAELLSPEERAPEAAPVAAPEFDVAPVGSDMGELKRDRAPVAPDISGLRLEGEA